MARVGAGISTLRKITFSVVAVCAALVLLELGIRIWGPPVEPERYRNLLVQQAVRLKNRISGVLLECGEEHVKSWLHGKKYFYQLLDSLEHTPESAIELLAISRGMLETFQDLERRLMRGLQRHPLLAERVEVLASIRGVAQSLGTSRSILAMAVVFMLVSQTPLWSGFLKRLRKKRRSKNK